jgi:hypothetical protein
VKIVVSGRLANAVNQGGAAWVVLQYLLGLGDLGHDVYFIESLSGENVRPLDADVQRSDNATYFSSTMRDFGLEDRSALLSATTRESAGLDYPEVKRVCRGADLLLNLSGALQMPDLIGDIPVRAYVDIDPGFTQLWQAHERIDMGFDAHTHFVTIGESIGRPDGDIPDCGRTWVTTRQPVFLDEWPVATQIEHAAFTTVANWRGYGSIDYRGRFFGQKAHSLRGFFELPRLSGETFELALAIHPDEKRDLEALGSNGWRLLDPLEMCASPDQFRRFVRASRAEFGIAKSGYVSGRTGWFSDRSTCYLASGRPVIAQDTGFGVHVPSGEGLFSFETMEDVLAGIDSINTDYERHALAARSLAETYFDSRRVLTSLLDALSARSLMLGGSYGR